MPLTQAAKALGVSPTTVRRRIAEGQLAAQRQPHRGSFRWLVLIPAEGSNSAGAGDRGGDTPDDETPSPDRHPESRQAMRAALVEVRETEESLLALAARVELARREIIQFVEGERSFALVQADRFEDAAREAERAEQRATPGAPLLRVIEQDADLHEVEDLSTLADADTTTPSELVASAEEALRPAAEQGESGSVRALLLSSLVLVAMVAVSFLALPVWANGIVTSVAVVAGLIAVVELFLVVSGAFTDRGAAREDNPSR